MVGHALGFSMRHAIGHLVIAFLGFPVIAMFCLNIQIAIVVLNAYSGADVFVTYHSNPLPAGAIPAL